MQFALEENDKSTDSSIESDSQSQKFVFHLGSAIAEIDATTF
jgi:hypothetical protein